MTSVPCHIYQNGRVIGVVHITNMIEILSKPVLKPAEHIYTIFKSSDPSNSAGQKTKIGTLNLVIELIPFQREKLLSKKVQQSIPEKEIYIDNNVNIGDQNINNLNHQLDDRPEKFHHSEFTTHRRNTDVTYTSPPHVIPQPVTILEPLYQAKNFTGNNFEMIDTASLPYATTYLRETESTEIRKNDNAYINNLILVL